MHTYAHLEGTGPAVIQRVAYEAPVCISCGILLGNVLTEIGWINLMGFFSPNVPIQSTEPYINKSLLAY